MPRTAVLVVVCKSSRALHATCLYTEAMETRFLLLRGRA